MESRWYDWCFVPKLHVFDQIIVMLGIIVQRVKLLEDY